MRIGYEAKRIFHNRSGLGNYGRNLLRSLATFYPENHYLLYNPGKGQIPFGRSFPCVSEERPPFTHPLFVNIWRQRLLSDRAAKDRIDIFHGLSQELPAGLSKKGIPCIVTVHDLIFLRKPQLYRLIDRKIYTKKVQMACKQADVIVAISEQTRRDLEELLGVDPRRVKVIYQGCDPLFWEEPSPQEIQATLDAFALPRDFMLFVGTLEERKNIDKIVAVAEKLEIPTVLVGKKTAFWKNRYSRLPRNIYTPVVENNRDLRNLYRAARIFVYPSVYEGFGIPVLEALVSRTPVITSNLSSLPEVAGPASILIDPASQDELTASVRRVWQSQELRQQMTESGHIFAQHFKDETLARQWQMLYQSLI